MKKLNYLSSREKFPSIKPSLLKSRCDSNGKFLPTKYSIKSPFISPTNQIPKRRKNQIDFISHLQERTVNSTH